MITSWRLCNARQAGLTGESAARAGGRWNHKDLPVVYSAECLPLATLEAFVHLHNRPDNQVYVRLTSGEHIVKRIEDLSEVPANWKADTDATRKLGSDWLWDRVSAVLSVPSAVVPLSRNFPSIPITTTLGRSSAQFRSVTTSTTGRCDKFSRRAGACEVSSSGGPSFLQ